jgi:hypothetical protein
MVTDGVVSSMTGILGDTEIATPLVRIDCRASTALGFGGEPVELAHAARFRSWTRTWAGV